MGMEQLNRIYDLTYQTAMGNRAVDTDNADDYSDDDNDKRELKDVQNDHVDESAEAGSSVNRGRMLVDATACPQDISYPRISVF
jgi:hypothetical protein